MAGPGAYCFDVGIELCNVEQTATELRGCNSKASGSAALAEGSSYMFVEVVARNSSTEYVEELQYTQGLDWRKPGVQILALLAHGQLYGSYGEALRQVSKIHQTAGLVLEAGFVWVYVDGAMVHCMRDPGPACRRLLARVHGRGHLRLIPPPRLWPCALGWFILGGHITLCWGDEAHEPRPSPELFRGPALCFVVASKWKEGEGYDLLGSRPPEDCINQARFPKRNDGGSPGSSSWWHCTGGNLDDFLGKELPRVLDGTTLVPFGTLAPHWPE